MFDFWPLIAACGTVLLLGAWREYASGNRRGSMLLVGLGAGGMLASTAMWLV